MVNLGWVWWVILWNVDNGGCALHVFELGIKLPLDHQIIFQGWSNFKNLKKSQNLPFFWWIRAEPGPKSHQGWPDCVIYRRLNFYSSWYVSWILRKTRFWTTIGISTSKIFGSTWWWRRISMVKISHFVALMCISNKFRIQMTFDLILSAL